MALKCIIEIEKVWYKRHSSYFPDGYAPFLVSTIPRDSKLNTTKTHTTKYSYGFISMLLYICVVNMIYFRHTGTSVSFVYICVYLCLSPFDQITGRENPNTWGHSQRIVSRSTRISKCIEVAILQLCASYDTCVYVVFFLGKVSDNVFISALSHEYDKCYQFGTRYLQTH